MVGTRTHCISHGRDCYPGAWEFRPERWMLVEDRGEASKGNLELAKGDILRVQFGSQRDELSMVNEPRTSNDMAIYSFLTLGRLRYHWCNAWKHPEKSTSGTQTTIAIHRNRKYSRISQSFLPASPHRSHNSISHRPNASDAIPSSKTNMIDKTVSNMSHQAIGTG